MTETIESTAVELYEAPQAPANLFGTDDPAEVVVRATRVADALKDVLVHKRLTSNIQGREHVRVEGWQLLGSMLGVTAVCVSTEVVENGWKATVEARAADGRVVGRADSVCTRAERQWKSRDDYALLSMAQTRATSKALKGPLGFVVSLAGYETTPAEEMTFAHQDPSPSKAQTPVVPSDGIEDPLDATDRQKPRKPKEGPVSSLAEKELVTESDIEDLRRAAKGLKVGQIRGAMQAVGVTVPHVGTPAADIFRWVPRVRAARLCEQLSGVVRL